MIGPFASGANISLVAKNGTKQIISLILIKSALVDRFLCLRYLNNPIDLPDMIGSFASGATASLVAKIRTNKIILLQWIKSSKKPQIKKFHKTDPPNMGILIQNTISKFSKTKNQTKKRPPKVKKN